MQPSLFLFWESFLIPFSSWAGRYNPVPSDMFSSTMCNTGDAKSHTLDRDHNSFIVFETRKMISISTWTFPVFLAYYRSDELSLDRAFCSILDVAPAQSCNS